MGAPDVPLRREATAKERRTASAALLRVLEDRPEVVFAYVHGSWLAGPHRDIDVAVYVDGPVEYLLAYEHELSVALGRAVEVPVDVKVVNDAPLGFQHAVLNGSLLTVRDEAERMAFFESVSRRYMDFGYLREQFMREILHG